MTTRWNEILLKYFFHNKPLQIEKKEISSFSCLDPSICDSKNALSMECFPKELICLEKNVSPVQHLFIE